MLLWWGKYGKIAVFSALSNKKEIASAKVGVHGNPHDGHLVGHLARGGAAEQTLQATSIEGKESQFLSYLDQLGQQGWELLSHIHWADGNVNVFMLKRPV